MLWNSITHNMPDTNQPDTNPRSRGQPKSDPFRNACITWFTDERPSDLWSDKLRYFAYGVETCPTTQRVHLQGWATTVIAQRLIAWKKLFPGAHIERMKGNYEQNDTYCSKESTLTKLGERPMLNGLRKEESDMKKLVEANPKTRLEKHFQDTGNRSFLVFNRAFDNYRKYLLEETIKGDFAAPEVIYIYGKSGTGKSRLVFELEPELYECKRGLNWFDGYNMQEAVLIDNLEVRDITDRSWFLRVIDRYPMSVPVKGGFVPWKPKRIYITSTYDWHLVATKFRESFEFMRRVTVFKSWCSVNNKFEDHVGQEEIIRHVR